jgi:iron(III) transport system ATP-binding protein
MTALRVHEVTKRFDHVSAVDHVSFELGDRELLALVGPSGCGKSSLLRLIAGLHATESGSIELGGRLVDDGGRHVSPPEVRRVGLVFQEHALFPHLTVARNVGFGVRHGGAAARVAEMLGLVGLDAYGERYPHELSGGERQRVALARALAPEPTLLLLDEPFASLDPNLRAQVRDDVVAILRSTGTPAVFVTHDQNGAMAVGDRVAVMRAGRIAQLGSPAEVFHQPVDRFVAAFMGEADFVSMEEVAAEIDGLDEVAVGDGAAVAAIDRRATLMVRPDDLTFSRVDGPAAGHAEVVHAEFRGSTWCYTLRLRSGSTVRSVRSHLDRIEVGTRVDVALIAGHRPVVIPHGVDPSVEPTRDRVDAVDVTP